MELPGEMMKADPITDPRRRRPGSSLLSGSPNGMLAAAERDGGRAAVG